jgi:hypothetical protein
MKKVTPNTNKGMVAPMRVATSMGWQHQCKQCQHKKKMQLEKKQPRE